MLKKWEYIRFVTDERSDGVAKRIADESIRVSTCDFDGLLKLIKEKNIDGVFCGPSEFNIRNLIKLCEMAGLPCYTNSELWEKCANKDVFKQYCRDYGVDCIPEYDIDENTTEEELAQIDYPIMIKPVDGSSSFGVSVCNNPEDVSKAVKKALENSKSKKIIAEKYIDNGGEIFSTRYLLQDGKAVQYLTIDTYIADPIGRKAFNSSLSYAPSKYTEYYMNNMDEKVKK